VSQDRVYGEKDINRELEKYIKHSTKYYILILIRAHTNGE
jgi:hypothetical protein